LLLVTGITLFFVVHIEYLEFYDKKFRERFDVLFAELSVKRQRIIIFPFVFFVRRLLLVCCCHLDIMSLRIGCMSFYIQTAYLVYWIEAKPIIGLPYKVELVNEILFIIMLNLQPIFTPLIPSQNLRY
jgi:hypothetical protein